MFKGDRMQCCYSLPGREAETEFLESFITDHYKNKTSGSLYISGPPGSGKTSSLNIVLSLPQIEKHFKIVYINCTSFTRNTCIYNKIVEELCLIKHTRNKKVDTIIYDYFSNNRKMTLLVLDEIDQLINNKQSLLYTIFEWPSIPNSKLILIGIANALDLTNRVLPRLQGNAKLKPTLLHFSCYTKQQIVTIITQRLKEACTDYDFPESAIHLLSAKIAAFSGDIRKAIDIANRVIDLAEDKSAISRSECGQQKILLTDVISVLNDVYGTTTQMLTKNIDGQTNNQDGFPLQHKLIICSLLLFLKNPGSCKEVTINKLYEIYKKVCEKRNLLLLDLSEFTSVCSLVETKGVFIIKGKTRNRLSKIHLQWNEQEIMLALKDGTLLADILNDTY